ncbi:MAG TPA: AbrB/MazE/SpoVT family DNA-binding domain-containing protein [Candidatus Nanoarchaeia archaeon]|nr:AbrB/MazE/SpoVT family DNA-binding domain-containing protein [Candidatus Nanoarchaeia archaeon]
MASISITKISSKGQVVIPQEMRKNLKEGDKLVVIKNDGQIILKKMEDFDRNLKEDLEFARRTEIAWKEIESGKGIEMTFDEFVKEMKKW